MKIRLVESSGGGAGGGRNHYCRGFNNRSLVILLGFILILIFYYTFNTCFISSISIKIIKKVSLVNEVQHQPNKLSLLSTDNLVLRSSEAVCEIFRKVRGSTHTHTTMRHKSKSRLSIALCSNNNNNNKNTKKGVDSEVR